MESGVQQGVSRWVWTRRGLVLVIIGMAWAGGYWAANSARNRHPTRTLVVAEKALDFGEVWEDAAFMWELPLENRGESDLRVVEFGSSCGCLAVEPPSLEVAAGQTATARLKLDLTYATQVSPKQTGSALEAAGAMRNFSVKVGASVQGPDGSLLPPIAWTIRGRVRPVLTVEPRTIGFIEQLVQGQSSATRTVSLTAHTSLQCLDVICEPDLAMVELSRPSKDGSKYELTIRPRSGLKPGPMKFNLVLRPQTAEGPLPRTVIQVHGRVLEDIQATPALVQFGACPVGKTVRESVVLRSWSGTAFEVERVECGASDASLEVAKVEPAVKEYRIVQRVTRREKQSGTIRFHVRPKGGAASMIPVQVYYLGVTE